MIWLDLIQCDQIELSLVGHDQMMNSEKRYSRTTCNICHLIDFHVDEIQLQWIQECVTYGKGSLINSSDDRALSLPHWLFSEQGSLSLTDSSKGSLSLFNSALSPLLTLDLTVILFGGGGGLL